MPAVLALTTMPSMAFSDTLDLSGSWRYELLDLPDSVAGTTSPGGTLILPGTLDTNGVGIPVAPSRITTQLSRRHTYTGRVRYSREVEIPASMAGKSFVLEMERSRPSFVTVDGKDVGGSQTISATQSHILPALSPGRHTIDIIVDNGESIPAAVRNNSHACAEATQTNWNGIIGRIGIVASDPGAIVKARALSDASRNRFRISGSVSDASAGKAVKVKARAEGHTAEQTLAPGSGGNFDFFLELGPLAEKWSEWNPRLYDVEITLEDEDGAILDDRTIRTGLREFSTSGTHFTINGDTTFLRGRHDACVWPLTAHVPMDIDSWRGYFRILKNHGINHVRFHSWCPPEACFEAADEAGVYLQPELTIWGGLDKDQPELLEFLDSDMEDILRDYASHPSFTMFAIGNELWGDVETMRPFIDKARSDVPGLLATFGSNVFLGWNGHIDGEDFLVTCRVGGGEGFSSHARASFSFADADNGGIMNTVYPNSDKTFSGAIAKSPVPVVGHETGQYQVYPDFREIEKYTGVLRPDNLEEFRNRADSAGTLRKASDYFRASGEWAARLYKEDMEMNLRTPGMGGFQLLDIQDYPGQGTALVGMLDAFMDSKGFMDAAEWRRSCDDVAVLAALPRYCFTAGDFVEIPLELVNYSDRDLGGTEVVWELPFAKGTSKAAGGRGVCDAGRISLAMPYLKSPRKVQLKLSADSGKVENSYDIWIYPKEERSVKGVVMTRSVDEALALLEKGKRVILCPDSAETAASTLGPLFQTDYWNYRMFRTICEKVGKSPSPGTMGLLIDNDHPALSEYPTDSHTDWQWFPVVAASRPLVIDRLPASVDPIVEPIDNVERNYRLALLLECNVGKGKLMILMSDPDRFTAYPEGRWFLHSIEEYMASKKFKPTLSLTPDQVRALLTKPSAARTMGELNNISY